MSVKELRNKQTGYHGFQACVGHSSKAFSVKEHGVDKARALAHAAEKEFKLAIANGPAIHRRSSNPTKRNTNGVVGIGFKWVKSTKTGLLIAVMWGEFTNDLGESDSFSLPFDDTTVVSVARKAKVIRQINGFSPPPSDDIAKIAKAWLEYTSRSKINQEL